MAKKLPAVRETGVRSLSGEDSLEKKIATHSSILVWEIPWTEEPGRLESMGLQRVRQDLVTEQHLKVKVVMHNSVEWNLCVYDKQCLPSMTKSTCSQSALLLSFYSLKPP